MASGTVTHLDGARSRLRALVAIVDGEMTRVTRPSQTEGGVDSFGPLRASWADLVRELALGPEPEVRECPVCGSVGMRDATRCGHCWAKLTPPPREGG